MIRYVKETLISSAFPWTDMVGNELPWQQRLYTSDGVSFRVGPVRVRQVRMPRRESRLLFHANVSDVCVRSECHAVSPGFYFMPMLGTCASGQDATP